MFLERSREVELVDKATRGDRAAAAELLNAHEAALIAFLTRISGSHEAARDIAQEAFYRALKSLHRFDTQYRFSTWLFTIARRVYLNNVPRRPRPVEVESQCVSSDEQGPLDVAMHEDARSVQSVMLRTALAALPLVQREAIVLFHQQGWSLRVIAQVLEIPEGTVKSHLHRGRARLRLAMEALHADGHAEGSGPQRGQGAWDVKGQVGVRRGEVQA
jgi:RNA polymerase sigma-70 factor (ECF subfamily)